MGQQLLFLIADHSHTGMLENCLAALEGATSARDKLARLIRPHLEFAVEDMDRIKVHTCEIGDSPTRERGHRLEERVLRFPPMGACTERRPKERLTWKARNSPPYHLRTRGISETRTGPTPIMRPWNENIQTSGWRWWTAALWRQEKTLEKCVRKRPA